MLPVSGTSCDTGRAYTRPSGGCRCLSKPLVNPGHRRRVLHVSQVYILFYLFNCLFICLLSFSFHFHDVGGYWTFEICQISASAVSTMALVVT